ncbi:hypothetical protein HDU67_001533 [Dinochytrium kinnereticum]|nr:hypothetical protein HDU67_001533 [Dinochytrium kinnereticum]
MKTAETSLGALGNPERESTGLSEADMAFLQLYKNNNQAIAKPKTKKHKIDGIDANITELIHEIECCPVLRYGCNEILERLFEMLPVLSKPIPEDVISEIKLCCDFMQSGEIKQTANAQASTWLRWTPLKPELNKIVELGFEKYREQATTPVAGELVGGYLKRLIQSIEGGLILKPFCDLLMDLFEDTQAAGNVRVSPESKPLIRAILQSNPQRHEILKVVSEFAQYIVRENGVQPKSLAVVFAVHDLQSDIVMIDPNALEDVAHRLKVKRDFERWNAVWGTLMNNFEFFAE